MGGKKEHDVLVSLYTALIYEHFVIIFQSSLVIQDDIEIEVQFFLNFKF